MEMVRAVPSQNRALLAACGLHSFGIVPSKVTNCCSTMADQEQEEKLALELCW